ncbi:DHH family phosphoesterase [Candidatus Methanoliparum sp. LAM-1]|uniref:DHH family phosphoesterase n=1 Tax=Candidatus Methanoliparum sp. LAM-1 TaxID=2874846 RepID=UPI001E500D6D|nr:DHH family phosphoesterase [Candidatus Methanoliparum sp. LAM-1]BDC36334.1 potassium transporter TrkA [Candidatus Methanoliparum sp. LAM-1]
MLKITDEEDVGMNEMEYLVIGYGSFGNAICKELKNNDAKFFVIDKNESKIETLKDENFDAIAGDILNDEFLKSIRVPDVVIVVTSDISANIAITEKLRKFYPNIVIFARASNDATKEELEKKGANNVIIPQKISAKFVYDELKRLEKASHAKKLLETIKRTKNRMAIIVHDNPDPDALSSAITLKFIAKSVSVDSDIFYKGNIGHQENRSFVNLLDIDLKKMDESIIDIYDTVAFVDTVPGSNSPTIKSNIIIDHHQKEDILKTDFVLIEQYGSTASIMTHLVQDLDLKLPTEIATALLYGIRSDTLDFTRNTTPEDLTAAAYLYPLANSDLLKQISSSVLSTTTLNIIGEAIRNRVQKGSYLVSNVGFIRDRDSLAQAADFLLKLEGVTTTLIYGIIDGESIYISARTKDVRINIGDVLKDAFKDFGSAGGRNGMAAAQIPLGVFSNVNDKDSLIKLSEEAITKNFFKIVGVEDLDVER